MSDTVTGSVSVEVVPDATRWASRLRAAILKDADRIGAEFGKAFGEAASKTIGDAVARGVEKSANQAERAAPAQGAAVAGKFAAALKARLEAALKDLPEIEVDADTDPARRELAAIRAEMKALADAKIGVDIDAGAAQAQLAVLQERLRALSASDADVRVRVDAGAASAELVKFEAEVDRVDGREIDVQADADTTRARAQLDSMGQSGNIASGRILAMVGAIGLIGPALGPLAAIAAGAFSAIAVGAAAAATGVGVLVLALGPVIGATQAVLQNQNRANTASAQAESRAFALASAQDSLKAALRGVASAQADAAAAAERADRRIADARRRAEDAARSAASAISRANRSVAAAESNLADAQRDALRAQEALTQAREDYARDQEDLASRLANGVLDEREATLRLAEARQDLARAEADPRVSELEREQARLAVDQAVQGLKDQQVENARLAKEKADADRDGIEGSEKVVDAARRVEDANRRVADAEERVRLAVEARAQAQQDAARAVADAQRDVAEAQADAAQSQRRSAESIAAAQQAVVNAHRAVEQASLRSATAGGAATEAMQRKLAALAPEGRAFVKFLTDELIPQVQRLTRVAQAEFLPGLTDGLRSLIAAGPEFEQVISVISRTLGDMASAAGDALASPFWRDFLRFMSTEFPPVLRDLGTIFGNLARAFAGFMRAMDPVNDAILDALVGMSDRLADLATDTGPDSPIQRFVQFLLTDGPRVAGAILSMVGAVGEFVVKLAPLGVTVAEAVGALVEFIAALPQPVLEGVALGIGAVALAISAMNFAMSIAALGPAALVATLIGALAAAAVVAYRSFTPFRRAVDTVADALKRAGISIARDLLPGLRGMEGAVRSRLVPAFVDFLGAVGPFADLLIDRLAPIISLLVQNYLLRLRGLVEVIAVAFRVLAFALRVFTTQMSITASLIPGFSRDTSDASDAASLFGGSAEDAAESVKKLTEEQDAAAQKARDLAENTLTLRDAENAYEDAIDRAAESLKENGRTLDVHTEKGRANRSALDDVADAANRYAQQLSDNGASEKEIQKQLAASRDRLIQEGIRFGLTRDAAKKYADQVLKVPTKQETKVTTPGAADADRQVKTLTSSLKEVAKQSTTTQGVIATAWEKIRDLSKVPIRFVINTVLGGLASKFNSVSSKIGGPTIPVPSAGFAAGGVLPGYTPGRDVHEFFSPTAGLLALSGGEAIMRPEFTRAVGGAAGVEELNRLAISGAPLVEMFGAARFADGGVVDFIKSKASSAWDWVTDKTSALYGAVTNPLQFLGGISVPGGGVGFGALATAAGQTLRDALATKIRGLWSVFKDAFDVSGVGGFPPAGGAGMGYAKMADWVARYLPGVAITSSYRPGAITATGNASYHSVGRALDLAPSMATFETIRKSYPNATELIYSPAGSAQLKNGRNFYYGEPTRSGHFNHVHWAMAGGGVVPIKFDTGGWLPTGVSTVLNDTGRPEPVLNPGQWDSLRQNGSGGVSIQSLTIQMPTTAGTLDMLSPTDRKRAARAIHDELLQIGASRT